MSPIGYSTPSHPSSPRLSSYDSNEEVPGGTHLNGVCEELEYDYDEQTEAWKWFQQSLEEESQPWKPRNIPHVCYAFFAEKDLEEFQDRIKGCDLTETDVDQFIRDYMKYIGETSDIRSRKLGISIIEPSVGF
uniref:Uncharacterized protein n=1 Tax=Panagrolaimus superbus TaxID=310955 RepID=A0A914YDQ8_9BILA